MPALASTTYAAILAKRWKPASLTLGKLKIHESGEIKSLAAGAPVAPTGNRSSLIRPSSPATKEVRKSGRIPANAAFPHWDQ
ncbi:hypothetical protein [uncultured Abyssibacter sp.]|uniref:hypothetical protein n=1 Tax=uncultured Abyssibacter sp. TaxID=2320202 RepID=UPI0032B1AAA9